MASMELRQIGKSYGAVEVLRDVNLDIGDGEFVVLVGPSGCGKSTLLRMIAGLEPITSGELRIDGERMNEIRPRDRDIAMVFQSYALYPHMNVARNMGFPLEIAGVEAGERRRQVERVAAVLGLELLLERLPRELSGGQRQRVAMGRAIIRDPRAFLFDEPLSNLDAALRVEMRLEIARLHHKLGATMVYVTHDQVEALTLADRIVVLQGGVIQQVGSPLALYERPANRFVAQFIGSPTMNIIPVFPKGDRLKTGNGAIFALRGDGDLRPAAELGVRPEHIDLVAPGTGDFDGHAEVVEHLGSDTNLYVRVDGVGALMVRTTGNARVSHGERVGLRLQTDRISLFATDGSAIDRDFPHAA